MRYPGGKGKCFQHIINLMPPHRVYIETHLGGGSVLRNKRPAEKSIAVEVDPGVIQAWQADVAVFGLELVHGRAEDFLAAYPFAGDELLYVDPPYHPSTRRRSRVYAHDYTDPDHQSLLQLLLGLPCKVMLSGYACELYDRTLAGWHRHDFQAKTHRGIRTESLWLNFNPPRALHDARYLGGDFREREVTRRRLTRLQDRLTRMSDMERAAITRWLHEQWPEMTKGLA